MGPASENLHKPGSDGLFDHLIGARQQHWRNLKAERTRRLTIDDELEFGRLQDREVRRLSALEDAARINADLPERIDQRLVRSSSAGRLRPCGARNNLREADRALPAPASCAARPAKKPSAAMKRASHVSRAKAANAASISAELLALKKNKFPARARRRLPPAPCGDALEGSRDGWIHQHRKTGDNLNKSSCMTSKPLWH